MAEVTKTADKPKVSKADVVLRNQREIAARSDKLLSNQIVHYNGLLHNIQSVEDKCEKAISECMYVSRQNTEIFISLQAENKALKNEIQYLAVQNQKVFEGLSDLIGKLSAKVDELMAKKPAHAEKDQTAETKVDYDELVDRIVDALPAHPLQETASAEEIAQAVVAALPAQEVLSPDYIASKTAEQIVVPAMQELDYDELAEQVAKRIEVPSTAEVDYNELAEQVAERIAIPAPQVVEQATAVQEPAEIDYDRLAQAVIAALPSQEVLSPDYIASKTAEQIVVPAAQELDYEALAEQIAQKISVPQAVSEVAATAEIDYDDLATRVAEKVVVPATEVYVDEAHLADVVCERIAAEQAVKVQEESVQEPAEPVPAFDSEELADRIARKVGSVYSDEFEVLVDEEGCDSIAQAVVKKFDYEALASRIYENLKQAEYAGDTPDYEEIASHIADKITVSANINEDVIADKAAAVLSNYLPEFDTDDVADKVVANVLPAIPPAPVVDTEGICNEIVERLAEQQENADYDIIIDEDGIDRICERVTEDVKQSTSERFASVDDRFDRVTVEFEKIAQSFEDYNKRFDEISQTLAENNGKVNELAQSIQDSNGKFEEVTQSLAENNNKVDELSQSIQESNGKFEEVTQSLAENNAKVDELSQSIQDSNGKFEEVTQSLAENNAKVDELSQSIQDSNGKFEEVTQSLAENNNKVDELSQFIQDNNGKFEEVTQSLAENNAKVDELSQSIQDNNGKFEEISRAFEENHERFNKVDEDIAEIKAMLTSGVIRVSSDEIAASEAVAEQTATEVPAEDENAEAEEELITVSDIVDEDEEEAEGEENDLLDEIVDDIDEQPVVGEMMPDGLPDIANGVDFANMMKYNRSFIARIIQSTDDQKRYYGEVKNAFLSYKKVNSSIAWGAERFNKGRETIAKFKIRGKTLCLYLALDPNEFATSVYHQVDVSDNKSMHGTPMMVKIKSPRGVKKAIRLIDVMLSRRDGVKRPVRERDYAAMYPYETIPELIEDGLVKDVSKNK